MITKTTPATAATAAKIFKTVQTKNTKEAYQKFIYDYPFGAYADKAKQEMAKKWPTPTRVLKKNKYI